MTAVHFEVFARRAGGGFNMELMLHDGEAALEAAEAMYAAGEFVALRVTREILDPETGAFTSTTLLKKGPQDEPRPRPSAEETGPLCRTVEDLYAPSGRVQIQRVLEAWLIRARATPFELLHRPDLALLLEQSHRDLQHALQKIAVPQALACGTGVHGIVRGLQALTQQAINRLLADGRRGEFPAITPADFPGLCRALDGSPQRLYRLGGAVAGFAAGGEGWCGKLDRLLDLADSAPTEGSPRTLALQVLAQPIGELLAVPAALAELLGAELDLGGRLALQARLIAPEAVAATIRVDPALGELAPVLSGPAERLARRLGDPELTGLSQALHRQVLRELAGPRRLRPADPVGEVAILRMLSMVLSAAAGDGLAAEPVREALIERGRSLVGADFITAYLAVPRPAVREALDLLRLLETVSGQANRRQALRWLDSNVAALRFETEILSGAEPPTLKLAHLARLHRQAERAGAGVGGLEALLERLSALGDRVEGEARLAQMVARSSAPMVRKLDILLRMATGETAPPGPAAERSRGEARRLIAASAANGELAASPEAAAQLRAMMKSLQAAA